MDLGNSTGEILGCAGNALMKSDKGGNLKYGMNIVIARMNGHDVTIMANFNMFKGTTNRGGKMSSTFASLALIDAVKNDNSEDIVSILEPRIEMGEATDLEGILCGVLLFMPPFADYEKSKKIFSGLMHSSRKFEAAVWDAYRHAVLMPDEDCPFDAVLKQHESSSVAWHMLSLNSRSRGNFEIAMKENKISRSIRLFPFNIAEFLENGNDSSANDREEMWRIFRDLVISRCAEEDNASCSIEGMLQSYWDNLILGTRITSQLWGEYLKKYG